jgi:hypothetical protein
LEHTREHPNPRGDRDSPRATRTVSKSVHEFSSGYAAVGLIPGSVLARKPSSAPPKPTSDTFTLNGLTFHLTSFGPGIDPSSIGDFSGQVGVADAQGTGTATYRDGSTEQLLFDTDMRFMSGSYVGFDGAGHGAAFALL